MFCRWGCGGGAAEIFNANVANGAKGTQAGGGRRCAASMEQEGGKAGFWVGTHRRGVRGMAQP
jgi:hypothetical protein